MAAKGNPQITTPVVFTVKKFQEVDFSSHAYLKARMEVHPRVAALFHLWPIQQKASVSNIIEWVEYLADHPDYTLHDLKVADDMPTDFKQQIQEYIDFKNQAMDDVSVSNPKLSIRSEEMKRKVDLIHEEFSNPRRKKFAERFDGLLGLEELAYLMPFDTSLMVLATNGGPLSEALLVHNAPIRDVASTHPQVVDILFRAAYREMSQEVVESVFRLKEVNILSLAHIQRLEYQPDHFSGLSQMSIKFRGEIFKQRKQEVVRRFAETCLDPEKVDPQKVYLALHTQVEQIYFNLEDTVRNFEIDDFEAYLVNVDQGNMDPYSLEALAVQSNIQVDFDIEGFEKVKVTEPEHDPEGQANYPFAIPYGQDEEQGYSKNSPSTDFSAAGSRAQTSAKLRSNPPDEDNGDGEDDGERDEDDGEDDEPDDLFKSLHQPHAPEFYEGDNLDRFSKESQFAGSADEFDVDGEKSLRAGRPATHNLGGSSNRKQTVPVASTPDAQQTNSFNPFLD